MTSPVAEPETRGAATIDTTACLAAIARCTAIVRRHADRLTRLDAALGDGDHGDNLRIGFAAVEEALAEQPPRTIGEVLSTVGTALVGSVGGASGPLYGAAFLEAGFVAGGRTTLDASDLATLLRAAADGLARRGRCGIGDKTIYDALGPAAAAAEEAARSGADVTRVAAGAARAAGRGMRATRPLVARRGLAMRLGERSRGRLDPGAASCFLLLRALTAP